MLYEAPTQQENNTIVQNYEFCTTIGTGTYGTTNICRDIRSGCIYACKCLFRQKAGNKLSAFSASDPATDSDPQKNHEVVALRRVNEHPHFGVPSFVATVKQEDELFIVMELIPGISLTDLVYRFSSVQATQCPVVPSFYLKFFTKQLLYTLWHCHIHGVAHMDVKPDNLIVMSQRRSVLIDFGQAYTLTEDAQEDAIIDGRIGALAFLPPEVLEKSALYSQSYLSLKALSSQQRQDKTVREQLLAFHNALRVQAGAMASKGLGTRERSIQRLKKFILSEITDEAYFKTQIVMHHVRTLFTNRFSAGKMSKLYKELRGDRKLWLTGLKRIYYNAVHVTINSEADWLLGVTGTIETLRQSHSFSNYHYRSRKRSSTLERHASEKMNAKTKGQNSSNTTHQRLTQEKNVRRRSKHYLGESSIQLPSSHRPSSSTEAAVVSPSLSTRLPGMEQGKPASSLRSPFSRRKLSGNKNPETALCPKDDRVAKQRCIGGSTNITPNFVPLSSLRCEQQEDSGKAGACRSTHVHVYSNAQLNTRSTESRDDACKQVHQTTFATNRIDSNRPGSSTILTRSSIATVSSTRPSCNSITKTNSSMHTEDNNVTAEDISMVLRAIPDKRLPQTHSGKKGSDARQRTSSASNFSDSFAHIDHPSYVASSPREVTNNTHPISCALPGTVLQTAERPTHSENSSESVQHLRHLEASDSVLAECKVASGDVKNVSTTETTMFNWGKSEATRVSTAVSTRTISHQRSFSDSVPSCDRSAKDYHSLFCDDVNCVQYNAQSCKHSRRIKDVVKANLTQFERRESLKQVSALHDNPRSDKKVVPKTKVMKPGASETDTLFDSLQPFPTETDIANISMKLGISHVSKPTLHLFNSKIACDSWACGMTLLITVLGDYPFKNLNVYECIPTIHLMGETIRHQLEETLHSMSLRSFESYVAYLHNIDTRVKKHHMPFGGVRISPNGPLPTTMDVNLFLLIAGLLHPDHKLRLSVSEALGCPFFAHLSDFSKAEINTFINYTNVIFNPEFDIHVLSDNVSLNPSAKIESKHMSTSRDASRSSSVSVQQLSTIGLSGSGSTRHIHPAVILGHTRPSSGMSVTESTATTLDRFKQTLKDINDSRTTESTATVDDSPQQRDVSLLYTTNLDTYGIHYQTDKQVDSTNKAIVPGSLSIASYNSKSGSQQHKIYNPDVKAPLATELAFNFDPSVRKLGGSFELRNSSSKSHIHNQSPLQLEPVWSSKQPVDMVNMLTGFVSNSRLAECTRGAGPAAGKIHTINSTASIGEIAVATSKISENYQYDTKRTTRDLVYGQDSTPLSQDRDKECAKCCLRIVESGESGNALFESDDRTSTPRPQSRGPPTGGLATAMYVLEASSTESSCSL